MDIRIEDLGSTRRKIHVTIPGDVVKREVDGIYVELKKNAKVRGFRPGKIPRPILERYYGDYVKEQAISKIIRNTYEGALSEGNIQPVSEPTLENGDLAAGEPFEYAAIVEVRPKIDVTDYTGIPVRAREPKVEENDTAERLEQIRNLHARLEPVQEERVVRQGDFLVVDFDGTIDGRPFKGGKGENVSIEVGTGRLLPDLEAALIGMGRDEEKEIEVVFPEVYRERHLAGQTALFWMKVKEIREKVLPALDDEFAKDVGEDSLKDLEGKVRRRVEEEKRLEVNREMENQIIDFMVEKNEFEVPLSMVEQRLDAMIRELKSNLAYQGVEFSRFGFDEEKLRDEYRERAVRSVKSDLLLNRVAELEKIEVTDEEMDQRLEEIAGRTNRTREQVDAYYRKNNLVEGLRAQVLEEKTLRFLLDRATMTDAEPQ